MNKISTHDRGSTATKCIEDAWAQLRELIPGLPRAVIVLLDAATRTHRRGHFARSTWRTHRQSNSHEIGISPALFGNPEELLATLLHEAAHALNHARNVPDVTGRYYHRKQFRETCEHLGLECTFLNTRYGWTNTGWPQDGGIPARYGAILEHLKTSIPYGAGSQQRRRAKANPLPKKGHIRMKCNCSSRSIYANRKVARRGGISCSICGTAFRVPVPD